MSATHATHATPVVGDVSTPVVFLEGDVNAAPQLIDTDAALTDVDSTDFDGGNLIVSYLTGGSTQDQLGVRNQGTGFGEVGVSGSTVTFAGVAIGTIVANEECPHQNHDQPVTRRKSLTM